MELLFRKYVEMDVQSQLESSGSQDCDVTFVRVTKHENIFVHEREETSISNVGQTCQDRTLELLEEETLSANLEILNILASDVPLNVRCYSDPEMGVNTRLCELDYQELKEGAANAAVQQSCQELGGSSIYVSFLVYCHLLLEDESQTDDPVLIYNDINVAACISPMCTEEESRAFYSYLLNEQVDVKLEGGGSQRCALETIQVEKSHSDNIFASRQRIPLPVDNGNNNEGVQYGTDSFAIMPTSPPRDIDQRFSSRSPGISASVDNSVAEVMNSNASCNKMFHQGLGLILMGSLWCTLLLLLLL
jgi:hypothetical protein